MQVWTNCRLYNAEGSDISRACKRLEKHALAAWKEHELSRKHGSSGEPIALDISCLYCLLACMINPTTEKLRYCSRI